MEFQKPVAGTVLDHHCALRGGIRRATRRIGIQFPNPEPAAGAGTFWRFERRERRKLPAEGRMLPGIDGGPFRGEIYFQNWISSPVLLVLYKPVELAFACAFRPLARLDRIPFLRRAC
jgi:hypothetical protein